METLTNNNNSNSNNNNNKHGLFTMPV